MAQVPTEEEVRQAQLDSSKVIEEKRKLQADEGKDFVAPEDGHGPGVIPEEIWKGHKS